MHNDLSIAAHIVKFADLRSGAPDDFAIALMTNLGAEPLPKALLQKLCV